MIWSNWISIRGRYHVWLWLCNPVLFPSVDAAQFFYQSIDYRLSIARNWIVIFCFNLRQIWEFKYIKWFEIFTHLPLLGCFCLKDKWSTWLSVFPPFKFLKIRTNVFRNFVNLGPMSEDFLQKQITHKVPLERPIRLIDIEREKKFH